jgi:dipeptidase
VPPNQCVERRRRAAAFLAEHRGQLVPSAMRTLLRDHYDAGTVHRPRPFDDPFFFSICMHADPLDNTTASMVAPLPADPDAVAAIAVSLGSPCVGTFLPVWLDAPVPARLGLGGGEPDAASPWWRMRAVLDLVERDVARHGPTVRARWDAFETTLWRDAAEVERATARHEKAARRALLGAFSEAAVDRWLEELDAIAAAIR